MLGSECSYPGCQREASHTCCYCGKTYCVCHVSLAGILRLRSQYSDYYRCSLCCAESESRNEEKKTSAASRHIGEIWLGLALMGIWLVIVSALPSWARSEGLREGFRWVLVLVLLTGASVSTVGFINWGWVHLFGIPAGGEQPEKADEMDATHSGLPVQPADDDDKDQPKAA